MKTYKVLQAVSDSRDNHKRYDKGSEIKLDKARAEILLERGVIAELDQEGQADDPQDEGNAEEGAGQDNLSIEVAPNPDEAETKDSAGAEPLLSGLFEKQDKEPSVTKEDKGKGKTKAAPKAQ